MGKIIVITSGKGGVGKTVAVSNIGTALAMSGKKVLIADIDIGLRNLDIAMGLQDVIVYDIMDVIENKCDIEKACYKFSKFGELYMLPAAQSIDKDFIDKDSFVKLFSDTAPKFDYILIDCPAGIENGFKAAVTCADMAIVTLTPEMASVRDADKVITLLSGLDIPEVKVLLNRVRKDMIKRGDMLSISSILDILGVSPIGIVEEDEIVLKSQMRKTLAVLESSSVAGKEFKNIAERLKGKNIPITRLQSENKNLFKLIFGL